MKLSRALLCTAALALTLLQTVQSAASDRSAVDRPKRVVTLAPSLGELASELLGDDLSSIVGVSEFTDYPPALKKARSIGRYDRFNIEQVLSLKPDLVLATTDGNSRDQVQRLQELGLRVVVISTEDFEAVARSMEICGEALGLRDRGARLAAQFREGIAQIRKRADKRRAAQGKATQPRILLQVGSDPLVVAGGRSFLNSALELVGAVNVYGDRKEQYPRPAIEDAVHRNPDQILVVALAPDDRTVDAAARSWSRFRQLKAVKADRVRVVRADALVRPSLRLLEGLSLLERAVHGAR